LTAAAVAIEPRLCACGCGRPIGPKAVWLNGSHANGIAGRATRAAAAAAGTPIANAEGDVQPGDRAFALQMAAEMRGECSWCQSAWNGSAHEVLTAQRAHRAVCLSRPAETRVTLAQRRVQAKRDTSLERERTVGETRVARQQAQQQKDEKLAATRARNSRDTLLLELRASGLTLREIAAELTRRGVLPARAAAWTSGLVDSGLKLARAHAATA
jgi:hypothetical protein